MDSIFGNLNGGGGPSQFNQAIVRCPFLRNINEPTDFSFSTPMAIPLPVHNGKGPIFEDGPNFDMAFRLFHGQNGVVPLSGRSFVHTERTQYELSRAQFNPLAAKAATISLSGFGTGGPFGFDGFFEKWKKENKDSKSSKKNSSSKGGKSEHEAMGDQWLQNGNCPIAKSYRAVSHVLPLVAKALQPPPGMKYKCPPAIVAARSALAKTAFAKNLRPQPKTAMAFTIAASILGQVIGSRAERYRLKTVAERKLEIGFEIGFCASSHWFVIGRCVLMRSCALCFGIVARPLICSTNW